MKGKQSPPQNPVCPSPIRSASRDRTQSADQAVPQSYHHWENAHSSGPLTIRFPAYRMTSQRTYLPPKRQGYSWQKMVKTTETIIIL